MFTCIYFTKYNLLKRVPMDRDECHEWVPGNSKMDNFIRQKYNQ
jgi:hypothetical protein